MTKGNSFTCPKEDCEFHTTIRTEMVYHAVKVHNAKYSKQYVVMLQPRTKKHEAMRKELLESFNE